MREQNLRKPVIKGKAACFQKEAGGFIIPFGAYRWFCPIKSRL